MTDGLILPPGAGRPVQGGGAMTLKVGAEHTAKWSAFETSVAPGFDVGAHWHRDAEELFYILDGELDLLAFEPESRADPDWTTWQSASGMAVTRGGPGSLMYVPAGCPHAFTNPGSRPARMLFLVTPSGHEHYLAELGALVSGGGPPDHVASIQASIAELRARWDIEQLTPMIPDRRRA
jgi:oxalate decarboxylase/phosphoglucose isomerase-like protein (cupin superfamily)